MRRMDDCESQLLSHSINGGQMEVGTVLRFNLLRILWRIASQLMKDILDIYCENHRDCAWVAGGPETGWIG